MVGTEEGQLFKCSTAYSSEYLQVGRRGQAGQFRAAQQRSARSTMRTGAERARKQSIAPLRATRRL